jgi:small-conductance mechanosensitive channel
MTKILDQINLSFSTFWGNLGSLEKSIASIIISIAVYYFLRYVIIRRLETITNKTDNDLDDRLVHFIKQFLWIGVVIGSLIWVLNINGVAVSPILAGAGIFGIAVGLAAKETIADILSGIFLIVDRPIRIGDRVTVDKIGKHWGGWGDIVDIGLRRTVIRNTDGVIVNYPNSLLSSGIIKNFSINPTPVRARIRFQVDYSADPELIKKTVFAAIKKVDGILEEKTSIVIRSIWDDEQGHQLSGVLYEARYLLEDVKQRTTIRSKVLEHIIIDFQKNNIPMASQPVNIVNKNLINN